MTFQENLKTIRKQKGFTQEELAIRCGVVRQTVSKWEKGLSVPDADLLVKLAEVLEVDVAALLGGEITRENANEIVQQLARINEQLAIRNRRSKRIWRGVCIGLIILVVVPLVSALILSAVRFTGGDNDVAGTTSIEVTYQDQTYPVTISYNQNYQILECTTDMFISNRITEVYPDVNEYYAHLKDYFELRGGTVKIVSSKGIPLVEADT